MEFTIHIENNDFAMNKANQINNRTRVENKLRSQGINQITELQNGDLQVDYDPQDLRNTGPDQYRTVQPDSTINFLDLKQVMRSSPNVKFSKKTHEWYVRVPVHSRSKMMVNPYQAPQTGGVNMRTISEKSNPSSWIEINNYGTYNRLKNSGQLSNINPSQAQDQLQDILGDDGQVELGSQFSLNSLQNQEIDQQKLRQIQQEDLENNNGSDLKKQTLDYIKRQTESDNQQPSTDDTSLNERSLPNSFNPAANEIKNQLNHTNQNGLNAIPIPPDSLFNPEVSR